MPGPLGSLWFPQRVAAMREMPWGRASCRSPSNDTIYTCKHMYTYTHRVHAHIYIYIRAQTWMEALPARNTDFQHIERPSALIHIELHIGHCTYNTRCTQTHIYTHAGALVVCHLPTPLKNPRPLERCPLVVRCPCTAGEREDEAEAAMWITHEQNPALLASTQTREAGRRTAH